MPGYYLRFHEHFARARELLKQRRLGKILQVQASAVSSGPYRGWDPKSDWYFDPRNGGPLYDWGSHLIDLLVYITDLEVDIISATAQKSLPGIPVLDNIVATFQARRGVVGTVNLAWGVRGGILMLQIYGSAGSLLVSDDYFEHRTPIGGGLNKLGTLLGNAHEILTLKAGAVIHRRSSDVLHPKITQCFIEAIRGDVQIQNAKWDAVRVHLALGAIADSIAQGKSMGASLMHAKMIQGKT
jgi:predicted dehydrogenase